jgi:hypothetical protein
VPLSFLGGFGIFGVIAAQFGDELLSAVNVQTPWSVTWLGVED